MSKGKKDNVHLKLSEELEGIDAELGEAMDALSATNERIDSYLNDDGESIPEPVKQEAPSEQKVEEPAETQDSPETDNLES